MTSAPVAELGHDIERMLGAAAGIPAGLLPDHLRAWYAANRAAVRDALVTNASGFEPATTTAREHVFDRRLVWKSPNGAAQIALHRWPPAASRPRATAGVVVHNHMMPVAGLILDGALRHAVYPALDLAELLRHWLAGTYGAPGEPHAERYAAGDAYELSARDFHTASNGGATPCFTLFVMLPRAAAANVYVDQQARVVSLKVASSLVPLVSSLRETYRRAGDDASRGAVERALNELWTGLRGNRSTTGAPVVL